MGIIKQGILGGFKNKVGVVIGSSWKGIAVMRAMPLSVANPRTTKQQTQRGNFGGMAKFGSKILSRIQACYNPQAKYQSGFNMWLQQNLAILKAGTLTSWEQGMQISKGELSCTLTGASYDAEGLYLEWNDDNVNPKDKASDRLNFAIVQVPAGTHTIDDVKITPIATSGVVRDNQSDTFNVSLMQSGTVYVKAYFVSQDGKDYSNTASRVVEFLAE